VPSYRGSAFFFLVVLAFELRALWTTPPALFTFIYDAVSLCSPVWPWNCGPPASASQVLGLQAWITMPILMALILKYQYWGFCEFGGMKFSFFVLFYRTGVWTQGLTIDRQALYHLSHSASQWHEFVNGRWLCTVYGQAGCSLTQKIHRWFIALEMAQGCPEGVGYVWEKGVSWRVIFPLLACLSSAMLLCLNCPPLSFLLTAS
jgi:hypothetical protein